MKCSLFLINTLILIMGITNAALSITPIHLTTEYLTNPTGLDEKSPRFSWTFQTTDEKAIGQKQNAYRILVSNSENNLQKNMGDVWDSKWVASGVMQLIEYKGKPLVSDRIYFWKVMIKDEKGNITNSTTAYWSTGLFDQKEWTAKWIGSSQIFNPGVKDCNVDDPWLRKSFDLEAVPQKATIFIASVGYHELYVNGKKIDDHVLAGAVTDHTKRARYIAYNISDKLRPGKNVIALWLGSSWSIFPSYATSHNPRTPMVIAQADFYDVQMKHMSRLQTDDSWKIHSSPNRLLGTWEMHNYGGEIWDANKEIEGWNLPAFNDKNWKQATVYNLKLKLSAQVVQTNKLLHEINPIGIEKRKEGYRIDMGVNFAGWTRMNLRGNPGDTIRFLYSEREQDEKTFNLRSMYVIGPTGKGTFQNKFNYSSARWIMIKGLNYQPNLDDIKGWVVRTNYSRVTQFQSNNDLQNWIYDRSCWNYENLTLGGYVVDCPQRERFGYGGDAHATSEAGMYNYQVGAFYTKWMLDWHDVQGTESIWANMNNTALARKQVGAGIITNTGVLPHTAPTYFGGGGPAWGGIVISLPWYMYQHYGDKRILERNFVLMKRWLTFLQSHSKGNLLQRFGGQWDFLGDWLWPNATAEGMNNDKPENLCFNNSYYVYNLRTAAQVAIILGKTEEAKQWSVLAEATSAAINKRFFNEATLSYADGSQSNLAMALLANVPPKKLFPTVLKTLEKKILVDDKGHIGAGITGGSVLFKLLRDLGRDDLIYTMVSKTDYPSWGYMRASGATSLWEMWEKDLAGHSLLHSSYLYAAPWYVDGIGGIKKDERKPGFQHFIITVPNVPEKELSEATTNFDSPAGLIRTKWKRTNGRITLDVTVPPNCSATIHVPSISPEGKPRVFKVKSGQHQFQN
mgnify:CR=1 FL=1